MSKSTSQSRYSDEDMSTTYRPKTASKTVMIQRSSGTSRPRSSMYGGSSGGFSMSRSFNPAVYTQMSATGIADFRGSREREKKEMQDCNERLATYIEKVRWLEAQNKKLEAELEALRNRKQEDWKPIRDMYEGELEQARKVIAELSSQKGVQEGRMAGYQDEIQSLRDLIAQYDNNAKDYVKKIDTLNSQVGEYEGEVTTLRMRCGSLEDEVAKLRALLQKFKDENQRLRSDLDNETAAHIEQEVLAQTKTEECEFLQDILDKLQLMQQEPITVKGVDMEAYFKGELRHAIAEMQNMYDERLDAMSIDVESKYAAQMNQLRSGNVRDSMESEHAKGEIKRLRDQLSERSSRIAELESMLASIKAERDNFHAQLNELQLELERERTESSRKLSELQQQIEALMQQLSELIDAKMSLELEIACYKKLLEGEENRVGLRQLVEQTIGSQGRGAANLSGIIGQSNMSQSTTARTTIQRSSKGSIAFQSVDPAGACVSIENTSSGARAKTQSLKGWKLVKEVNKSPLATVDLGDRELRPGQTLSLFAKGAKSKASNDNEIICEIFSWGTGNGKYILNDDNGVEKATLTVTQVM
ncbi:retrograde protein of 51 kDa-like [Littorina saxatilis]|uniref:Uncharacterized protein n=1 Tax=Littorina saxatilis TaxID=31220 RepID=A0AAN9AXY5_9CAEN